MKRTLLLALALCGASGAHAAGPLTTDKTLAAYCVGVAQARVLDYEHMTANPCSPDVAQCRAVRQLEAAAVPGLRHELEAANATLAVHGLLDDGRRLEGRCHSVAVCTSRPAS